MSKGAKNVASTLCIKLVSILNEGIFASTKALRSLDFRKGPFLIPFLREATKASTQR